MTMHGRRRGPPEKKMSSYPVFFYVQGRGMIDAQAGLVTENEFGILDLFYNIFSFFFLSDERFGSKKKRKG